MRTIIELTGASGATYRYTAAEGRPSPAAGNYAVIKERGDAWEVVTLGAADNLDATVAKARSKAQAEHGSTARIFVRLNISIRTRQEELEDLAAAYGPAADLG